MKKSIFSTIIIAIVFLTTSVASSQNFPKLDKSPADIASYPSSYKISDKAVKIVYGRPQLKGRALSKVAPNGKVWRTGANEAPEITFYKDVIFAGKDVAAGTYTLLTIPNEKEWTVILSNQKNIWGAYFYDETMDVVRVSGTLSKSKETIEAFSILFDKDMALKMAWGDTIVSVPISKK